MFKLIKRFKNELQLMKFWLVYRLKIKIGIKKKINHRLQRRCGRKEKKKPSNREEGTHLIMEMTKVEKSKCGVCQISFLSS